jgi:hypothetical protein
MMKRFDIEAYGEILLTQEYVDYILSSADSESGLIKTIREDIANEIRGGINDFDISYDINSNRVGIIIKAKMTNLNENIGDVLNSLALGLSSLLKDAIMFQIKRKEDYTFPRIKEMSLRSIPEEN